MHHAKNVPNSFDDVGSSKVFIILLNIIKFIESMVL